VIVVYAVIWSSAVILGLSAVWGLVWAIRNGQFQGLRQGAESIFDEDEPVGMPTDAFPGRRGQGRGWKEREEESWQR
jgi:cbb3-type cytochrome oxidase maturation protein